MHLNHLPQLGCEYLAALLTLCGVCKCVCFRSKTIETMTLTFAARLSPSHSLPTKYGRLHQARPPLPSDGRRINFNPKYRQFHYKSIRASSWTHSNNNNNSENSKLRNPGKRHEVSIVPSYSTDDQQQLDSNIIPGHLRFLHFLRTIYEFCRPYTMAMTVINVVPVTILPLTSLAEVTPAFLVGVLQVLILSLLVRAYISGINQIYDVEIDKVNKPYLPIPSGALSKELAVALVFIFLLGSVAMAIMLRSPPLLLGVVISCIFGALYSVELPFMRWKRYPVLVSACGIVHYAVSSPLSTFFHIQKYVVGRPTMYFTKSLIFTLCFMTLASIATALFKDVPDILGDKKHGFETLAVRLGAERVLWICISTLILIYGCAIGVGLTSSSLLSKFVVVGGHIGMACMVLHRALFADLSTPKSAQHFYMFLWKVICAEYLLIPFVL